MGVTVPLYEYEIKYTPTYKGRGLTKALNQEAKTIQKMEKEGWEFCGAVALPEVKLLGMVMRRVQE